jgi:hypothetical protein
MPSLVMFSFIQCHHTPGTVWQILESALERIGRALRQCATYSQQHRHARQTSLFHRPGISHLSLSLTAASQRDYIDS